LHEILNCAGSTVCNSGATKVAIPILILISSQIALVAFNRIIGGQHTACAIGRTCHAGLAVIHVVSVFAALAYLVGACGIFAVLAPIRALRADYYCKEAKKR